MKHSSQIKKPVVYVVAVILVIAGIGFFWNSQKEESSSGSRQVMGSQKAEKNESPGIEQTSEVLTIAPASSSESAPDSFSSVLESLKSLAASDSYVEWAEAAVGSGNAADRRLLAEAIAEHLRTGSDQELPFRFRVGRNGNLEQAPTARAALLDLIGRLGDPALVETSLEIMDQTGSADEYAIALRNLTLADRSSGQYREDITSRFREMLAREEWAAAPSDGFLEALDVGTYLGNRDAMDAIVGLSERNQGGAQKESIVNATFMAMDRIVFENPKALTEYFSEELPLDSIPALRASLLSRLDLLRKDHRNLFVEYLKSAEVDSEERSYFSSVFPNLNEIYGPRLASEEKKGKSLSDMKNYYSETRDQLVSIIEERPALSKELDPILLRMNEELKKAGQ